MTPGDTIVAPATPFGVGGLAIVRLSGPSSEQITSLLLQKPGATFSFPEPRRATLVTLYDQKGTPFEEAMVTFFKAPHSYTGEDIVEISCHGNPVVVQKIVSACCAHGARIADPGEFTRRAFLNGKMDLIQAESVSSFIHAQSEASAAFNFRLLKGSLSKKFQTIKTGIVKALSFVEFELDISEEDLLPNLRSDLFLLLNPLLKEIDELIGSYRQGHLLTDGALVVIVGKTNVGKSTLLNALSEKDRAITSRHPGTTRDPIDVSLFIDGVPIKLVDTAGLRKAKSEIEHEGIKRTHRYIYDADLLILLKDTPGAVGIDLPDKNRAAVIRVFNKSDLLSAEQRRQLQRKYPDHLFISAKTNTGIETLKSAIKTTLGISDALSSTVAITTARQHAAAVNCKRGLERALCLLDQQPAAYELVALELREALTAIDTVLGKTTPDDILNLIFNSFCVGK